MSDQVFEQYVDVYGNISVRVSQDIVVLTRDDADRLMARFDQLKAENARLRELVRDMWHDGMCECDERGACAECEYGFPARMHELGVEVP